MITERKKTMKKGMFRRVLAAVLLVAQVILLCPAMPVSAAADTGETPLPFMMYNASVQAEEISMSSIKYSDAIVFTMGYNMGYTAEATYHFRGQYSSLSFSAGYYKGWDRDANMTVIADGVVVKDAVKIGHKDVARKYTISLAGVSSLTIRFESNGYDTVHYAIANISAKPASGMKEETPRVSDEFYDIPRYLMEGAELLTGPFTMGGLPYENGYKLGMGYGWSYDYTADLAFNFQETYKKLTFDIARYTASGDVSFTRSAYLTIQADGVTLPGYDKRELKYNDLSLPVTVDLNGVTQLNISLTSNGYDYVTWAIGNVQLVSDGHAHGILLDKTSATLTKDAPTVDLNPRVYPSDAANRKFKIESDCAPLVSVDEKGIVTGHYKGNAVITATSDEGDFTAACKITSKLPAFELKNHYEIKYVEDTEEFTRDSADYITIFGGGEGSLAGDLARAYVEAGRVITDGYGGAINGLSDVLQMDIDVQNDYDFLLSDLLAGMMSQELYESILNDKLMEAMSDVTTWMGKAVDVPSQILAQEAITDFGELPDVINTQVQARWAEMKKLFSSKVTYEKAGEMFSVLGSAVDLADAVKSGCDDVAELLEYYILCNAFVDANEAYANTIKEAAAKMAKENAIMGPALVDAAGRLSETLKEKAEEYPEIFYLNCAKEVGEFALRTGQIISDLVDDLTGSVSILGAIREGITLGTSLSNRLTATDDRYFYGKMLHMAGYMAEGMHQVVLQRQTAFEKKPTFENAAAFSTAADLYLNLQILSCDYAIGYFNSYAACGLGQFKLFSDDEIAMTVRLLIYKADLMRLRNSGQRLYFGKDGSISGFVVSCPVTVVVSEKDGTQIARMETGNLTVEPGYEWAFRLMGKNHEQKAGFYNPELHEITILAEDDGTMHVAEFTGTADGIEQGSTYLAVPLQEGESYTLEELNLSRDGTQPVPRDEIYPEPENPDPEPKPDYHNPFVDVMEGDFYYDAVMWAVQKNVTTGTSYNTFSPGDPCTRGQIVTFLWRAAGQPEPASAGNPFRDVNPGDFYYKAVLWAVGEGITTGLAPDTFGPEQPCTRGQVATFLWRYAGEPEHGGRNPFYDVSATAFCYDAVLWAVENSVTNGVGEGIFAPDSTCTRAQIVTFLYRALGNDE